ncbi:RNase P/MRP, p29 subunit [Lentinula raphanica]|uniref:RNase P/MRP, p29 subunit n=1 Tax=Lentinula raphanica TaxID=153919 RepID=A0AA38UFK5_9AGAR|nr:RNase P/MRP, p29 subunit [Lentinula raphanica]KAJ3839295.1 RNase P/MRP, p29 subunit [Lentinula raphanica]KAJ3968477.1 RNase P/MRP, p29 subunit [Lentinula raphanica]
MDIYAQSPVPFNQQERLKFSSKDPFVPEFVKSSLLPSVNPAEIYATRVHGRKILLENPVGKREKKLKKKKRKQQTNTKSLPRISGSWTLNPHESKFDLFVPLHHLWMGYMSELLALNNVEPPSTVSAHPKLIKADYSGSFLSVQMSKNPSLVGIQGIVLHESENTFNIITKNNETKVLPKQNTIFTLCVPAYAISDSLPPNSLVLDIPHLAFTLFGNQFRFRATERAGRKFKSKETIEL